MYDICVVGGGAGGMFASVLLARAGLKVVLVEANDRLGKKLLATGNGKCNISNEDLSVEYYNTDKISTVLDRCNTDFLRELWRELGLVTKVKSGRVYPYSEQSNSVLNVLLENLQKYNVKVMTSFKVNKIVRNSKNFEITAENGKVLSNQVCLATGSNASFGLESCGLLTPFGHKFIARKTALCPMIPSNIKDIKGLAGVRQEGLVSLYVDDKLLAKEYGEVQFRKDAVSGIVIFNHSSRLSRIDRKNAVIEIDFMSDYTENEVKNMYRDSITGEYGMLNKLLMQNIREKGVESIKRFRIPVRVSDDISQSQVVCGGLCISEFDLDTMQSNKCNGLYAIGEAVDVDGLCGGYNLHWAFASAYVFAKGVIENATKIK